MGPSPKAWLEARKAWRAPLKEKLARLRYGGGYLTESELTKLWAKDPCETALDIAAGEQLDEQLDELAKTLGTCRRPGFHELVPGQAASLGVATHPEPDNDLRERLRALRYGGELVRRPAEVEIAEHALALHPEVIRVRARVDYLGGIEPALLVEATITLGAEHPTAEIVRELEDILAHALPVTLAWHLEIVYNKP